MAEGFFITGTDTGVGKTVVTVALGKRLLREGYTVAALKPVASGCRSTPQGLRNDDALLLQHHLCPQLRYEQVNPYAFAPPIAPHLAAALARTPIEIGKITALADEVARHYDRVLVEGVGGWQVPLADRGARVADLAKALRLPVILVVGIRLGCVNHALLSAQSIVDSGLPLAGWVANLCGPALLATGQLLNSLQTQIPAPLLGIVPFSPDLDFDQLASFLRPAGPVLRTGSRF